MVERSNFLDSNLLPRRLVQRRADDTVCALANNILNVILLADVEGDLAGTALRRSARHLVGIGTGSKYGRSCRKRRKREVFVGEEVEVVLCRLLSNLARVRQERKERWRGEVRSAFVVVEEEVSSRRESRSQSVLSQPRVISNTFVPVASKACPTCGMQHAQSDLQSTCLANQPLQQLSVCSRLQTPPRCRGCDLLFSCALMYFCRQMSVVFFLLLNSAWYDLLRSQLVCIPPSQLSAPLSTTTKHLPA